MKKIIYFLATIFAIAFTSCSDQDEIDIKYQTNIKIVPSNVISSFSGYSIGGKTYGLDMYEDENGKAELRITALLYDDSGKLVQKSESLLNDYSSDYSVSYTLDEGKEYTLIAISSSIQKIGSKIDEAYEIYNENELSKLQIKQNYKSSYYSNWTILGVAKCEVTSGNDISLNLKPATAMCILHYNSIHTYDSTGVTQFAFIYHGNDLLNIKDGNFIYSSTAAENGNFADFLDVTQNEGQNIVDIINIFPVENMNYFGRLWIGENYGDFEDISGQGKGNTNIAAGSTYNIYIDCALLDISITQTRESYSQESYVKDEINSNNKLKPEFSTVKEKVINLSK